MKTGQLTHDMLSSDVALVYRQLVTPEGDGMRLDLIDGEWVDADAGDSYATIGDAEAAYDGP